MDFDEAMKLITDANEGPGLLQFGSGRKSGNSAGNEKLGPWVLSSLAEHTIDVDVSRAKREIDSCTYLAVYRTVLSWGQPLRGKTLLRVLVPIQNLQILKIF